MQQLDLVDVRMHRKYATTTVQGLNYGIKNIWKDIPHENDDE